MTRTLEGVKPGDKIKCGQRHGLGEELFTVQSLTATLAKCERGISFRIDSGVMMGTGGGAGWDRRHGFLASEADVARIRQANAIRRAQQQIRAIIVTAANLEAAEAFIAASQPSK